MGLFSHGGHYVAVVGIEEDGETVIVLDPSQLPDKFHEEGREGKVIENGCILAHLSGYAGGGLQISRYGTLPRRGVQSVDAVCPEEEL